MFIYWNHLLRDNSKWIILIYFISLFDLGSKNHLIYFLLVCRVRSLNHVDIETLEFDFVSFYVLFYFTQKCWHIKWLGQKWSACVILAVKGIYTWKMLPIMDTIATTRSIRQWGGGKVTIIIIIMRRTKKRRKNKVTEFPLGFLTFPQRFYCHFLSI